MTSRGSRTAKPLTRFWPWIPRDCMRSVRKEDISMCGYGPAVAMLTAAKDLGATRAELVRYATSADTSGDRSAVVGYAGMVIS